MTHQGRSHSQAMRFACIITCLQTRACHFELVYSMVTSGLLLAFIRFRKRCGTPERLVSDNGSNFVRAERELKEAFKMLDKGCIVSQLAGHGIK